MKKLQKKYVRNYYGIAILLNVILPVLLAISIIGNKKGEIQLGYIFVGIWGLISALVFAFYFAIPGFNKNWEKIAGLLFPSFLLSLILIQSWDLIVVILLNLVMSGFFIWHLKKKTFANNAYSV